MTKTATSRAAGKPTSTRKPRRTQTRAATAARPSQNPRLNSLLATTALASALSVLAMQPAPAHAQEIKPGTPTPYTFSNQGSDGSPIVSENTPGNPGQDAPAATITQDAPTSLQLSTDNSVTVSVTSAGGKGGGAGVSYADDEHDGPMGGAGGAGGALTFTMAAPDDTGAWSTIQGFGANSTGLLISSTGGAGGSGGGSANTGNGGVGGTGGAGGDITLTAPANPSQPSAWNYFEGQSADINLISQGGAGGESGESQAGLTNKITGRKGGTGGAGGVITATLNANVQGGGSGLVALSQGGDGGKGGAASGDFGQATAGGGGVAGDGGRIDIYQTGGAIQAAGADQAATGPLQTYDAITTGQTVQVESSSLVAAISAISKGGTGGLGGDSDGFATAGGPGAVGGQGGDVTVWLQGPGIGVYDDNAIATSGYNAVGVLAVSAGGEGGAGETSGGAFFRSGGHGGVGGQSNSAQIFVGQNKTPYAKVLTTGDDSDALVAVSVAGGGGYGGDVHSLASLGFDITVGGKGGDGGVAGMAAVNNGYWDPRPTDGSTPSFHGPDVISTKGDYSRGIVAQSVGGGGGRGGDALSDGVIGNLAIGGRGGSGGVGGLAAITNYGIINTVGAQSAGLFAQSVGGGGGSGGAAVARSVGIGVTAAVAVGGDGGTGGEAGAAQLYNMGQVMTQGSNAHAAFAQSVGGGGGVGGSSIATTYALNTPDLPSLTLTAAVGGKGGAAGDGNEVDVMNAHLLSTQGKDAYGVFAQSVGGGGGAGGDASATSTATNQSKITVTTAIGGSGGAAGKGGAVNVWNSGLISTSSEDAIGVFAQSVGGGGGTGGFGSTNQGAYNDAGDYSAALTLTLGGSGGAGGDGGAVTVNNEITDGNFTHGDLPNDQIDGAGGIVTYGDSATGVFAQSIGGGGGNAGDANGKGGNGQISLNVGVGGNGGSAGDGGNVTVHNGHGAIVTYGANSYGVFGQSIGGGGGTGGKASTGAGDDPQYSYSEQGSELINDKTGLIKHPENFTKVTDTIWDWKDNVQGAWGDAKRLKELAGINNEIDYGKPPPNEGLKGADLKVDVGGGFAGSGGSSGNGADVLIDSDGEISTSGTLSHGIFGQSVGGGGGVGGASAPATANDQLQVAAVQAAIAAGGQGGKGGDSGTVQLFNNGGASIDTAGDIAFGMFAQTVGGGGGVAGASMPNAGVGITLAAKLGASGGTAGAAHLASVTNTGTITTQGDNASGMVAQSIGGGGGLVGITGQEIDPTNGLGISRSQVLNPNVAAPQIQDPDSNDNFGGEANANLESGGVVQTSGVNSMGILAQSIGGGGGLFIVDPNNSVQANAGLSGPQLYASAQQSDALGMSHNHAGDVIVTTQQNTHIITAGAGAVGIVAQSLGGGGALVNGFNGVDVSKVSKTAPSNRGKTGDSGNVYVTSNSDIITTGAYAHGIFAQAASGGGGVIGRADGTGYVFYGASGNGCSGGYAGDCTGLVQVNLDAGTIHTFGQNAYGVVLESQGNDYNNTSHGESYNEAHLIVGANARILTHQDAAGAVLLNGMDGHGGTNLVDNYGVIDASGSTSNLAITSVGGEGFTVNNYQGATLKGNLGTGGHVVTSDALGAADAPFSSAVTVNNMAGAMFEAGDTLELGQGGVLNNHGTLSVGAVGKVAHTAITGDLVQGADGVMLIDADAKTGTADKIDVSGKAVIAGKVQLNTTVVAKAPPVKVLTAAGGVTLTPTLSAAPSTTPFTDDLSVSGSDLMVQTNAHFTDAAAGLSKGQQAVAGHLQEVWDSGAHLDKGFAALHATNDDANAYAQSLTSLSGQALGVVDAVRYRTSQKFVGNMLSGCPAGTVNADGRCVWGRIADSHTDQNATNNAVGYKVDGTAVQIGATAPVSSKLSVSGSFGYGDNTLKGDGAAKVVGKDLRAGVMATYRTGKVELSAGVDAGHGAYRSTRNIVMGDVNVTAQAKPKTWDVGAHLRAAYAQPLGQSWTVKPFVDLNASRVHSKAFAETGAGELNLHMAADNDTVLSAKAGVELSGDMAVGKDKGLRLRPFVSASVEALDNGDWASRARFEGQDSTAGFKASTRLPSTLGEFTAGAELAKGEKWSLTAQYGVDIGKDYTEQTGALRFGLKF